MPEQINQVITHAGGAQNVMYDTLNDLVLTEPTQQDKNKAAEKAMLEHTQNETRRMRKPRTLVRAMLRGIRSV